MVCVLFSIKIIMSFISPDIISIKNLNQSFEDIDDLIRVRDFVVSRQFVIFDF